jgi:hypothetical protein
MMDLARRMLLLSGGLPPERHALPFDGVVDLAYAQGVRTATGTQYALVHKVASTAAAGANSYMALLSSPDKASNFHNISDMVGRVTSSGDRYRNLGINVAGGLAYSRVSSADSVLGETTAATTMVARNLTTDLARGRVVGRDGTIRWTFADISGGADTQPLDLVIGCATNNLFAPLTGSYFAHHWVASVVLDVIPTDAQLQAYAAGFDARKVWGANVIYYPTATGLVGQGSGPIVPVVGTAPLVLSGPVEGDLVPYV